MCTAGLALTGCVTSTAAEYIVKDKAVLSKFSWIHTIIDEGHRMKNANSKLSVVSEEVIRVSRTMMNH